MSKAIDIIIRAKDATGKAWKSVSRAAAKLKRKMKSAFGGMARFAKQAVVGIGLVGAAVVAAASKAVKAYQEQAQAEAKLEAIQKSTGFSSGFTTQALKDQAAALQELTGIGDETIISMQGILASFTRVRGDSFKRATTAALDMGSAMRKTGAGAAAVEGAVIMLGKALNDPVARLGDMSRVGVTFTETQKDMIKALAEAGDMAGAQAVILSELETEFGGTAAAMGDASHGLDQMKAAFGDSIEKIGQAIVETEGFDGVIERVTAALQNLSESGYIDLWAENIREGVKSIMPILAGAAKALGFIKTKIQETSAFWGAVAGGSSFGDAAAIAADTPAAIKRDRDARLAAIREEKAARKAATEEAEKAEMDKAVAVREAEEEITAEKEKQAAVAKKSGEDEKKAIAERVQLEKQAADLGRQIREDAQNAIFQNAKDNAEKEVADLEKRIAKIAEKKAMSIGERKAARRAEQKEARDSDHDARREARLREKERKGGRLGRGEKEFLGERDLAKKLAAAQQAAGIAKQNLEQRAILKAEEQRKAMVARLTGIDNKLAKNLELA